eukprot:10514728-Prorocentrum_lima.AAC.1
MYVWEEALECYATSHDEEELETGEVEFYLPPVMAHWHESCPHSLSEDEDIQKHHKEAVSYTHLRAHETRRHL